MEIATVSGAVEAVEGATRAAEGLSGVGGAFTMCVIAFSVVFLVLGGLTGVIYAIQYMAQALDRTKKEPPAGNAINGSAGSAKQIAPASDGRLMAVLTAAVAASGINGRITGVVRSDSASMRHIRSYGWRSAALSEGIHGFERDWK